MSSIRSYLCACLPGSPYYVLSLEIPFPTGVLPGSPNISTAPRVREGSRPAHLPPESSRTRSWSVDKFSIALLPPAMMMWAALDGEFTVKILQLTPCPCVFRPILTPAF